MWMSGDARSPLYMMRYTVFKIAANLEVPGWHTSKLKNDVMRRQVSQIIQSVNSAVT